jgi:hypothetical protein
MYKATFYINQAAGKIVWVSKKGFPGLFNDHERCSGAKATAP